MAGRAGMSVVCGPDPMSRVAITIAVAKADVPAMVAATLVVAGLSLISVGGLAPLGAIEVVSGGPEVPLGMLVAALPGFAIVRAGFMLARVRHPTAFAVAGMGTAVLTSFFLTAVVFGNFGSSDIRLATIAGLAGLVAGLVHGLVERKGLARYG